MLYYVSAPLAACVIVLGSSSSGEAELLLWHASVQAFQYNIILLYKYVRVLLDAVVS